MSVLFWPLCHFWLRVPRLDRRQRSARTRLIGRGFSPRKNERKKEKKKTIPSGVVTPASLGYPLSVFNKNSTLKDLHGIPCISCIKINDALHCSPSPFEKVMSCSVWISHVPHEWARSHTPNKEDRRCIRSRKDETRNGHWNPEWSLNYFQKSYALLLSLPIFWQLSWKNKGLSY